MPRTESYYLRSSEKKKQASDQRRLCGPSESEVFREESVGIADMGDMIANPVVLARNSVERYEQSSQDQIKVHVNVQLFRLLHIDESTENVTLDLGITFMWEDPHLAKKECRVNYSTHPSISRAKTTEFSTMGNVEQWPPDYAPGVGAFDPAWKIADCSESQVVKCVTQVIDPKIGLVHNFTHLIAKIHQPLQMKSFPFDTQQFSFNIRSEHTVKVMRFVAFNSKERRPKIYNHDATEWTIKEGMHLSFALGDVAASEKSYCGMSFHIMATRKPEWYLSNVILVSWMIVSASFSVFCISEDNMAERLGIIFTTWLLLVSLKFVIADRIPKIAYLTALDWYLLYSYTVMMLLVAHTCLQKQIKEGIQSSWEKIPVHECMEWSWMCLKVWTFSVLVWIEEWPEVYFMLFFFTMWTIGHVVFGYNYCYDSYRAYFVFIDNFSFLWKPFRKRLRRSSVGSVRQGRVRFSDAADQVVDIVRAVRQ